MHRFSGNALSLATLTGDSGRPINVRSVKEDGSTLWRLGFVVSRGSCAWGGFWSRQHSLAYRGMRRLRARADDAPTKRNPAPASAAKHVAGENTASETMYTVTYAAADILSQIQDERCLNAEDAKEFLGNRVKGPPVMQSEFDPTRPSRVRIEEPRWLQEAI